MSFIKFTDLRFIIFHQYYSICIIFHIAMSLNNKHGKASCTYIHFFYLPRHDDLTKNNVLVFFMYIIKLPNSAVHLKYLLVYLLDFWFTYFTFDWKNIVNLDCISSTYTLALVLGELIWCIIKNYLEPGTYVNHIFLLYSLLFK